MSGTESEEHYLSLISSGTARSQNAVLDTASSKVIKHGVIWHYEHTRVVFVWSVAVQNALAQKHRKRRGLRKSVDDAGCALEPFIVRVVVGVQVEQEGRYLFGVCRSRERLTGLLLLLLLLLLFLLWRSHSGCRLRRLR